MEFSSQSQVANVLSAGMLPSGAPGFVVSTLSHLIGPLLQIFPQTQHGQIEIQDIAWDLRILPTPSVVGC